MLVRPRSMFIGVSGVRRFMKEFELLTVEAELRQPCELWYDAETLFLSLRPDVGGISLQHQPLEDHSSPVGFANDSIPFVIWSER